MGLDNYQTLQLIKNTMYKTLFCINILLVCLLSSCQALPTVITEKFDKDGNLTERITGTVNNQVAYHNTMRQRDVQITNEPPLFEIKQWSAIKVSPNQTILLPEVAVHGRKEREPIERTPTTGEVIVKGTNGFIERATGPVLGVGITTLGVQQSRSNEDTQPNTTAGGDIIKAERSGNASSDKSKPVSVQESFNKEVVEITETNEVK